MNVLSRINFVMDKLLNKSDESFLRWRISVEEENNMIEQDECDGEPLLKTVVSHLIPMFCFVSDSFDSLVVILGPNELSLSLATKFTKEFRGDEKDK